MRYFNHAPDTVADMLAAMGKSSIGELFSSIPTNLRLPEGLDLPAPSDEMQLKRTLKALAQDHGLVNFIGAGATAHFVPEWVSQQLLRAEWYTSYTPYQPEVSQGTLQALFEFQSMVASLFGLDIANASLYDGATALVEALLMAVRTTQRKTVLVASNLHPEYQATLKTYLLPIDIALVPIPYSETGIIEPGTLKTLLAQHDVAAVALASPNFFGRIENYGMLSELIHQHQALMVMCCTDMSACALWQSFGKAGADIAVGEALGFVGGLSLGGPGAGLLAAKKNLLRQMPGRLVGATTDSNGHLGFTLTLSTREQHIRREKATSNICTNHNLMALAFAMTMASYGKTGIKKLALSNVKKTLLFRRYLNERQIPIKYSGPHYNETVVDFKDDAILDERIRNAREQGLIAGLKLSTFYPELAGHLLVTTTELCSNHDLKKLATLLSGARHE